MIFVPPTPSRWDSCCPSLNSAVSFPCDFSLLVFVVGKTALLMSTLSLVEWQPSFSLEDDAHCSSRDSQFPMKSANILCVKQLWPFQSNCILLPRSTFSAVGTNNIDLSWSSMYEWGTVSCLYRGSAHRPLVFVWLQCYSYGQNFRFCSVISQLQSTLFLRIE